MLYSLPADITKVISICLLAILFCPDSKAQDEREYLSLKLESMASDIPTDKVFLHTDRSLYQPGDKIYFQSYIADRFTRLFETASLSSYVLLTDQEGNMIDSSRFRIDYSLAPGWLTIPENCKPGWYCIKAFTSIMQNFEPTYAFNSWIRIDELIKEPVDIQFSFDKLQYNYSDTAEVVVNVFDFLGDPFGRIRFSYSLLVNDKITETFGSRTSSKGESTLRLYLPGSADSRKISLNIVLEDGIAESNTDIPLTDEAPDIAFLPEGGTFIPGYYQRVAFNAVRKNGEQLYLRGAIFDNTGRLIDSIRSGKSGPGLFSILPVKGHSYYAVFNELPGKEWDLPEISYNVPAIKVMQDENSLFAYVMGTPMDEEYYVVLSMNYNIVGISKVEDEDIVKINFITDSLLSGTARLTLFNSYMKPVVERCIIIRHKNLPSFTIDPNYKFYLTGQESELSIALTGPEGKNIDGIFSVAVIDSSSAMSPQLALKKIEDEFLLEKEIYDRIPDHLKKSGIIRLPKEELDLLMMTFGWVKYKWESQLSLRPGILTYFDLYRIDVSTILTSKKRKQKEREYVYVRPMEQAFLLDLKQADEDSYILDIANMDPLTRSIMVIPNIAYKRRVSKVTISSDYNNTFFSSLYSNSSPELIYRNRYNYILDTFNISLDSVRIIKGINVFAKRLPVQSFANQHEEHYQYASTRAVSGLAVEASMSFVDMLRKLTPKYMDTGEKTIRFRGPPESFEDPRPPPALFVLDGIPQGTSYEYLTSISPREVHSITVLLGSSGAFMYGQEARGGVVFIETKQNHIGDKYDLGTIERSIPGDILKKELLLFRKNAEFYSPPKEIMKNDPEYWIRPTLYWNPECFYDGKSPVKIKYFNHQKKGPVYIIVNGITSEGEPVSGVHKYKIR
ncbi:MAG: hypothetical protein QNK33_08565 [Bacteroidales bacterium]|nr:hypothetical protein [Bacteroidales bacterium]